MSIPASEYDQQNHILRNNIHVNKQINLNAQNQSIIQHPDESNKNDQRALIASSSENQINLPLINSQLSQPSSHQLSQPNIDLQHSQPSSSKQNK